jgi:hypothetical protein
MMNDTQVIDDLAAELFDVGLTQRPAEGIALDRTTDNGCGTQPACNYPQE